MKNILFTGFGAFGSVTYNPSWDAAQAAAEEISAAAELLPVTLEAARSIGSLASDDLLLVHFGVASTRSEVCLERYAHNWWKDLPDTRPQRLDEAGPSARECSLPLDDWADALGWRVSHDAGNYVCNATLYYALATTPNAMFVHIPAVETDGARELGCGLARLLADVRAH